MRRKLNLLDYGLILLVVLVIALFAYKQYGQQYQRFQNNDEALNLVGMTYTFKVEEIRSMSVESVKVGDILYEKDSKTVLGTVTAIDTEPYSEGLIDRDGQFHMAPVPEKYNLFITVNGRVLATENRYLAEGVLELKINSDIQLITQMVGFDGRLAWFD